MRVQHNIMAMNAYRNYTNNVSAMKKNLERLSSGYRINRAGDDAAGLAISEKMRAQITGLETAQKNAKDGISLVQTAEGALQEVHDMLNRMVELATQSANGTYDNTTDRAQLQKEVEQLKSEINRIADSANFNGIQLLDGSMELGSNNMTNTDITNIHDGTTALEAAKTVFTLDFTGYTAYSTQDTQIEFSIAGASLGELDFNGAISGTEIAAKIYENMQEIEIDGIMYDISLVGDGKLQFTSQEFPTTPTLATALSVEVTENDAIIKGATAGTDPGTAGNNAHGIQVTFQNLGSPAAGSVLATGSFELNDIKDGSLIKIGDTTYVFAVGANSKYKTAANVVDLTAFRSSDDDLNIYAAAYLSKAAESNAMVKVEANGNNATIILTEKEGGIDRSKWDVTGTDPTLDDIEDATWKSTTGEYFVQQGNVTKDGLMLQIGDTSDNFNQLRVSIGDCHTLSLGLDGINIANQNDASTAINTIKAAINKVSDVRGTLGATQNRLEHTINNLSVMTENIQDAESTIRDTDVAEEMMAYTKNNILIQSAQAMLAQANQIPQGVLQLLQ